MAQCLDYPYRYRGALADRGCRIDAMAQGDVIPLLTDGFYEQPDHYGEAFGQDRVGRLIHEYAGDSAPEIFEGLLTDFNAHVDGVEQNDDLTALILKRNA